MYYLIILVLILLEFILLWLFWMEIIKYEFVATPVDIEGGRLSSFHHHHFRVSPFYKLYMQISRLTIYFSFDQWMMIFFIFSVKYRNDVFQWEKCKHSTCETVYYKLFNWPAADIQRVLFVKYHHSKSGLCYLINLWIICYDATVSNYMFLCNFTTHIQYTCRDRLKMAKDFYYI